VPITIVVLSLKQRFARRLLRVYVIPCSEDKASKNVYTYSSNTFQFLVFDNKVNPVIVQMSVFSIGCNEVSVIFTVLVKI